MAFGIGGAAVPDGADTGAVLSVVEPLAVVGEGRFFKPTPDGFLSDSVHGIKQRKQQGVVGAGRNCPMKSAIPQLEGRDVFGGFSFSNAPVHALDISGRSAPRRQGGDTRFQGKPDFHDFFRMGLVDQGRKGRGVDAGSFSHKCSAAYMAPDFAFGFQDTEGCPKRASADAEFLGQYPFGWQSPLIGEPPGSQSVAQPFQ